LNATNYWIDAQEQATPDPGLRALHYGDGLFETLRVQNSNVEYLDRHIQRLRTGCERLQLEFSDWSGLETELRQRASESPDTVIKVILSRNAGARGYRYRSGQGVTRIVSTQPLPVFPQQPAQRGARVRICKLRLALQPRLAGIKHLNRLEQVMARAEWSEEYEEGLLLDYNEKLIEGTMSNLFLVRGGCLFTPRLDNAGVAGVMRAVLLDLAAGLGLETHVQKLTLADLQKAEEVFMCNSLIDIWPVVSVADQFLYPVGAMTQTLQRALAEQDGTEPGDWYSE
jgi:4-amino-4-deoxychorismate lyase